MASAGASYALSDAPAPRRADLERWSGDPGASPGTVGHEVVPPVGCCTFGDSSAVISASEGSPSAFNASSSTCFAWGLWKIERK